MIIIGIILLCLTGAMTAVAVVRWDWVIALVNLGCFLVVLYHLGINVGIYRSQPPR
jgi:hypothetical protein